MPSNSGIGGNQTYNAGAEQFLPTVQVTGLPNLGNFDKFTGGDAKAPVVFHRPGGMGPQITYLALPEFGTCTVTRVYDEGRDNALIAKLRTLVGSTYATVTVQPLDGNAAPYGTPTQYYGRISSVNTTDADSTSAQPRMWDLEISVESIAN
jgi:hypothetical protein